MKSISRGIATVSNEEPRKDVSPTRDKRDSGSNVNMPIFTPPKIDGPSVSTNVGMQIAGTGELRKYDSRIHRSCDGGPNVNVPRVSTELRTQMDFRKDSRKQKGSILVNRHPTSHFHIRKNEAAGRDMVMRFDLNG
jgi:hypothetical protein